VLIEPVGSLVQTRASTRADGAATAEQATSAFAIERPRRRPDPNGSYLVQSGSTSKPPIDRVQRVTERSAALLLFLREALGLASAFA
jgi:hypothetical protein